MKKTIMAILLATALTGGSLLAQEVSFSNRVGAILVTQSPGSDTGASFGYLYTRVVGGYQSRMFSLWGRAQVALQSTDSWKDKITANGDQTWFEFNGAVRPLPFLEFTVGNSFGTELPWSGYELPGAYGYGSDASYGLRKYSAGNGMAILFRGSGTGISWMEGLTIGWNSLPLKVVRSMGQSAWKTAVGINYNLMGLANLSFGGSFDTAPNANQTIGLYGELLAVENMKANLGVTMYTNTSVADPSQISSSVPEDSQKTASGFVPMINMGAQYMLPWFPMYLAADMAIVAGQQEVQLDSGNTTMMPILVGGLVGVNFTERLYSHVRVTYGDNLADNGDMKKSQVAVIPRLHYKTPSWGELRLDPGFTITNDNAGTHFGFDIGVFWEYKY